MNNSRIPNSRHLVITLVVRVHTIAEISAREASILVNNPDWRFSLVLGSCPGDDGLVEVLDLSVVVSDTQRYDLRDLFPMISFHYQADNPFIEQEDWLRLLLL